MFWGICGPLSLGLLFFYSGSPPSEFFILKKRSIFSSTNGPVSRVWSHSLVCTASTCGPALILDAEPGCHNGETGNLQGTCNTLPLILAPLFCAEEQQFKAGTHELGPSGAILPTLNIVDSLNHNFLAAQHTFCANTQAPAYPRITTIFQGSTADMWGLAYDPGQNVLYYSRTAYNDLREYNLDSGSENQVAGEAAALHQALSLDSQSLVGLCSAY
eukprot:1142835-Pelagomonas_calceolata.AAC.2